MNAHAMYSLCLGNFPGANYALENLARTTGMTRHIRLASPQSDSPEIVFVSELLRAQKPRVVLFGGWSGVYEALMQQLRETTIRFAVYWTSSGGQTDISQEMPKLAALLAMENVTLCFSGRSFVNAFAALNSHVYFLPPTLVEPAAPESPSAHPLSISLFCPPPEYKRKNILNTLLALAQVRGEWQLVLNGLSQNATYRTVLEKLALPYVEWGWMERAAYEKNLWHVALGLQFSFAETFDYVAAEHLLRGIPVLASPMVPVMELLDAEIRQPLIVTRADDADAMRERIQALIDDSTLRTELGARARKNVLAANLKNIAAARQVLEKLMDAA